MPKNKASLANDGVDVYHLENDIIVNGFVTIVSSSTSDWVLSLAKFMAVTQSNCEQIQK